MRFIYADEAGTSAKEPVAVVAGIIVEADNQLRSFQREVENVLDRHVPADIRPGFHIHAKEIFNGGKQIKRLDWPFDARIDFLKDLLITTRESGVPIVLGSVHREHDWKSDVPGITLSNKQYDHWLAFIQCMERADCYLQTILGRREIGAIVAEDVEEMRNFLKKYGLIQRDVAIPMVATVPNRVQKAFNVPPSQPVAKIEQIIDIPHFVQKRNAPLLQIADVCAFSFRRQLSKQTFGPDLMHAMLGTVEATEFIEDDVWYEGSSGAVFNYRNAPR